MSELWKVDNSDLIDLMKWYRRTPKQFLRGSASMLNDLAFGTKRQAAIEIDKGMVVRNPRFVASSLRVQRADPRISLDNQKSIVGSIMRGKFSGWKEQEDGTRAAKSRTHSLMSRGGSESGKVRRAARLRPGANFPTPRDFPGKNSQHRAMVMLIILNRERFKKPFIISGLEGSGVRYPDLKDGLYQFKGKGKLRQLQRFEKQGIKPKRVKWMSKARKAFLSSVNVKELWTKNIKFIMKRFKR